MKNVMMIFILVTVANKVSAGDELDKLYLFSEDVRDVVLKTPGGNPMPNREFQLNTQQSDQMKALANLDDSMREHIDVTKSKKDCDKTSPSSIDQRLEKRVDNRWFTLDAVVFASDKKFEQNALGRFMSDDYITYMGKLAQDGNPKAYDVYSIYSLEAKYKQAHPSEDLDKLSLSQKEKILGDYAKSYLGTELPSGMLMKEMAFQKLISNGGDWQKTLAEAKSKLSTDQKIALVSKLGGYMGNLYNYSRAEAGDKARGEYVDTAELLNSIKNGTPGGICRDIALAQTQFLKELGFNHNYVVGYKTISGRHAVVISEDPATGKIIKFNYNETTEMKKGSGTEALIQDTSMPDHGLGYNIYDSNGKPVTKVTSEIGQMLKDTAGGDIERDFNQRNFKLNKVGFSSAYVDGNLFTGTTSTGENLYGVSLYKNTSGNYYTAGIGASLSKLEGDKSLLHVEQENLYIRTSLELNTPKLRLGPTATEAFAGGNAEVMMYNSTEKSLSTNYETKAKNELDASADFYAGVRSTATLNDGKTVIDSKVYATFYPDWNHVASGDKTVAVNDSIVIKTGVSHAITDDTRALVDTAVVMRNYGTSVVAKLALEDDKRGIRYTAGAAVPVSRDMPTFLPGGERRAFASVEKMGERFSFGIEYERNIDNRSNALMLSGKVKF
jgi:hypothetical protein